MPNPTAQQVITALLQNDVRNIIMDMVTIKHSAFSQTLHFTRNHVPGGSLTVTLEDLTQATFQYLPMVLQRAGQDGNLNQSWKIVLQDLNTLVQEQEDLIPLDSTELPQLELRTYEYNKADGTATLIEGPYKTNCAGIDYDELGASINAEANRINVAGAGIKMSPDRYPTLRPLMR